MSEQELKDELDSLIREAEKAGFIPIAAILLSLKGAIEEGSQEQLMKHTIEFTKNRLASIISQRN